MEDTRKIQIAENKFPMLIMGDENRFLKTTYFQYIQYCESLSASFFKGRSTEVQNNILKANFGLTNEDILSWENRASRYQMTPQSFSFFLHVAMYSASHGFNAVYDGIQQRYAERKQIMNVVRKHEDKSKKRKAKKNKKKKHQTVDSDSDPLTNDESDDYMRNTVDDDDQIGDDQDVNINRSIADASGSQSHVDQPFDMDVTPVEPVSNLDVTMPQPQLLQQPDNNLSNLTKSSNKKKKSNKNIIQQVITGHKPGDDGTSQVRDILVYDIPVSWTPEEILQKLTFWGNTISLQMKQQKKYQTVRLKIELNSLRLTQFEGNDDPVWTTDLGGIPVRWFPARWTLKERKQREKFQATIRKIPESMTIAALWKDHCPHSFLSAIKDNQFDWEQLHLSWNRHDSPSQRTRSFGNNTNKDRQRTSGSRQTDKSKQNSKNSKKKPQEAKSEKHNKQKKDKSRKTSRSKVLAEILDVLRKLI
ncbi:hypothetical protein GLOIN_2v1834849 [Rhizophagus irregularis DAOM 181602=DAOM 197198]|nr:hypothetical protein GLOIN_2v1834849 [Rhizophagus irregularis DAOM 181602=DAOM 197198]